MAKVGFWLQGAHGQIAGANLSQSPGGADYSIGACRRNIAVPFRGST